MLLQQQHHLWEAPQGWALQEGVGGVRPDQGPRDIARRRPDRDRGEGDQPLGRTETEDQRRTVSEFSVARWQILQRSLAEP